MGVCVCVDIYAWVCVDMYVGASVREASRIESVADGAGGEPVQDAAAGGSAGAGGAAGRNMRGSG